MGPDFSGLADAEILRAADNFIPAFRDAITMAVAALVARESGLPPDAFTRLYAPFEIAVPLEHLGE